MSEIDTSLWENDNYLIDGNEVETHEIVADDPSAHISGGPGTYHITVSGNIKLYASVSHAIGAPLIDWTSGTYAMIFTVIMNEGETCIVTVSSAEDKPGGFNIDVIAETINDGAVDDEDTDSKTDMEETPENSSENNTVADPIDVSTGAHVIKKNLIEFNGGQKLRLTMNYNSSSSSSGRMGIGWYHNYEKSLTVSGAQAKVYERPGSFHKYTSTDGGNTFICSTMGRLGYKLTKVTDGYCLDRNGESKEYYDTDGKLVKIVSREGFETLITYAAHQIQITDTVSKAHMDLSLNLDGTIGSISDGSRTMPLYYENGYLVSYYDFNGKRTDYTYVGGRISTGTDANGTCYFNNEYSAGKVVRQKDALGNSTYFEYTEDGCVTTDRNGNKSTRKYDSNGLLISYTDENGRTTTYTYDENGKLTSETDALGNTKTTVYNEFYKPAKITDKNGNTTVFNYDTAGNLISIVYPSEEGVTIQKSFTYNDRNQLLTYTDERGAVTWYYYNSDGSLWFKDVEQKTTEYSYTNGLLTSEIDPMGGKTTYTYWAEYLSGKIDALGRETIYNNNDYGDITDITDPLGNMTAFSYDCNRQKIREIDANGNKTEYTYNGNMKLTQVKYPDGGTLIHEYDAMDRVIKTTDPEGNVTTFEYDPAGRLLRKNLPDGSHYRYIYDAVGNVLTEGVEGFGAITRTYDANGNILTQTDQNGLTAFEYDKMNRLIKKTAANGGVTRYTYSPAGDLLSVTDPLGKTTTYTYDVYGNKETMTDPLGNIHGYAYDYNDNLIEYTDPWAYYIYYEYDACNQLTKVIDIISNETTYGYDALGRRTSVTDRKNNTVTTAYDAVGNVLSVTDAKGNVIQSTTYNNRNLPATKTDATGSFSYEYNKLGKVTKIIDTNSSMEKLFTYDSMGRLTCVTDEDGRDSTATYNVLGKPLTMQGPAGAGTTYTYDRYGRVLSETIADGSTCWYSYNEMGLKSSMMTAKDQVHQYTYDLAGRLLTHVAPEGAVNYEYDANGNLLKITDAKGTRTRTYDYLNRVTSYTDADGNTVSYIYNDGGQLESLVYPDRTSVNYEYDEVGNLIKVVDWNKRETVYSYDVNNQLNHIVNANGSMIDFTYDDLHRMTFQNTMNQVYDSIVCYSWSYDSNGRLINECSQSDDPQYQLAFDREIEYNYLDCGWLNDVVKNDHIASTESFETRAYAAGGNLVYGELDYSDYDSANRLISYRNQPVTYDADGNMLSVTIGGADYTFAYDSRNRLISVGSVTYEYDPQNLRTKSICYGAETAYVYNPHAPLSQLLMKTTGDVTTKYVYGLGLIGEEVDGEFKTYHYDYRGSTVAITDEDANITDTFEYDTYGKLISHDGIADIPFLYNGRDGVMTEPDGLCYMRNRYYSPDLNRFINADVLPGDITNYITLNRYAYANNNPVMFVDPLGLSAERSNDDGNQKEKTAWEEFLEKLKNEDGSYSVYDSRRTSYNRNRPFHEQLISFFGDGPAANLSEGKLTFGELQIALITGGWEFEHIDLSLFDLGALNLSGGLNDYGFDLSAIASIYSPSITLDFGKVNITLGAELGAIGGSIVVDPQKGEYGLKAAYGIGGDISVSID